MARVRLRRRETTAVRRLLREIGQGQGVPTDLRHSASRHIRAVRRSMRKADVDRVAGVFRRASVQRELAPTCQDAATYWAAYFEGRVW